MKQCSMRVRLYSDMTLRLYSQVERPRGTVVTVYPMLCSHYIVPECSNRGSPYSPQTAVVLLPTIVITLAPWELSAPLLSYSPCHIRRIRRFSEARASPSSSEARISHQIPHPLPIGRGTHPSRQRHGIREGNLSLGGLMLCSAPTLSNPVIY